MPSSSDPDRVMAWEVIRDAKGNISIHPLVGFKKFTRATQIICRFEDATDVLGLDIEFQRWWNEEKQKFFSRVGRVSVVNQDGVVLYDVFAFYPKVKGMRPRLTPPKKKMGVYKDDINPHNGGARPIAEVEDNLYNLIKGRTVVGHALANDIKVCSKWVFEDCLETRDTQMFTPWCFQYGKAPQYEPQLVVLAKEELGMTIQKDEHASDEDAKATVFLYNKAKPLIDAQQAGQQLWLHVKRRDNELVGEEVYDDYLEDGDESYEEDDECNTKLVEFAVKQTTTPSNSMSATTKPLTAAALFWKAGPSTLLAKSSTNSTTSPQAVRSPSNPSPVPDSSNANKLAKLPASSTSTSRSNSSSRQSGESSGVDSSASRPSFGSSNTTSPAPNVKVASSKPTTDNGISTAQAAVVVPAVPKSLNVPKTNVSMAPKAVANASTTTKSHAQNTTPQTTSFNSTTTQDKIQQTPSTASTTTTTQTQPRSWASVAASSSNKAGGKSPASSQQKKDKIPLGQKKKNQGT